MFRQSVGAFDWGLKLVEPRVKWWWSVCGRWWRRNNREGIWDSHVSTQSRFSVGDKRNAAGCYILIMATIRVGEWRKRVVWLPNALLTD